MDSVKKTGLVLEGGAMRGIYTAGVLDMWMEHGISFDGVIGVSAGAIHGCSYVSGQKGRSIRYYKKYLKDKRLMSFSNWLRTGDLVDEKFCYHELPEVLDPFDHDAFKHSGVPFYVTCTNVETGKAEYILMKDMREQIDHLRASASMPYVSRLVHREGKILLDGGCADSIPIRAFQKMGYERNVVVLTRPSDYYKKSEKTAIAGLVYRRYPNFVKTLKERASVYNETVKAIAKMEKDGSIFVIRPSTPLGIGRMSHDMDELMDTYERGRNDALKTMKDLLLWKNGDA